MSHNFRIEPSDNAYNSPLTKSIKVYSKSNEDLPLNIDYANRYAVILAHGEQFLERIQNFEVRKDDVWVVTMPKCGTTWMLELVWLVLNDLDYDTALRVEQEDRCPFFEYCTLYPSVTPLSLDDADQLKSPRVIKTHLPMHMLPKGLWTVKPKIIYVARDAKDAGISFYYFVRGLGRYSGPMEELMNNMLNDKLIYEPFWPHIAEFWKLRNEPNVYFTSFERMKSSLGTVVLQVGEFLNKPVGDDQIPGLLEHLSFQKMRNNPTCNHLKETKKTRQALGSDDNSFNFIRKGEVGSHKEDLKEDMIRRFDEWTTEALKPYGATSKEILFS